MPDIDFAARRAWLDAFLDGFDGARSRVVVAVLDGRPAGFVTVDRARAAIDQLAVDPAFQGRGLAAALLDGAKTLHPEGLDLVVNRDNATARRLYARHGFRETARGTNPTSGLPTVLMRWTPSDADAATLQGISTGASAASGLNVEPPAAIRSDPASGTVRT